jgi:hypothetical protein
MSKEHGAESRGAKNGFAVLMAKPRAMEKRSGSDEKKQIGGARDAGLTLCEIEL